MGLGWDEAVAATTGPGSIFELAEVEIGGLKQRVYKNSPSSLRALFEGMRAHGDETFLVYEDERLCFGDFMARADELSAALVNRYAVAPGDRVSIAMRNYPEWVISFAAITSIGAICVSLNAWWTSWTTRCETPVVGS